MIDSQRDSSLVRLSMKAVCRTFGSDPTASARVIRRMLEPSYVSEFGFEDMLNLADQIGHILRHDVELVEEIYRAAFSHYETSDQQTSLGPSQILAFSSNRRQDYELALFQLAKGYSVFLRQAPLHATRALLDALDTYVEQRQYAQRDAERFHTIEVSGTPATLYDDSSHMWDDATIHGEDPAFKMLGAFADYLGELAGSQDEALVAVRGQLLRLILDRRCPAIIWRRLLSVAAHAPTTLGAGISSVSWDPMLLIELDTREPLVYFLHSIYGTLPAEDRARIERAILSVPDLVSPERYEWAQQFRDRHLRRLPRNELVTPEALQRWSDVETAEESYPVETPLHHTGVVQFPSDQDFELAQRGVPLDDPDTQHIRALLDPVQTFASTYANTHPTDEAVITVLSHLEALRAALSEGQPSAVHPGLASFAWNLLADASEEITRTDAVTRNGRTCDIVRRILVESADRPEPGYRTEDDATFDKMLPSWSPAARIDAATGLMQLARLPQCSSSEVSEAIRRLAHDPAPSVRFQIADRIWRLYHTDIQLMWELVDDLIHYEQRLGILHGLINDSLSRLAGAHPTAVAGYLRFILDRLVNVEGSEGVSADCLQLFTCLAVAHDEPTAEPVLDQLMSDIPTETSNARQLFFTLRPWLLYGPPEGDSALADAARHRAINLMERLIARGRTAYEELLARKSGVRFAEWTTDEQEQSRHLVDFVDAAAAEVYFGSGAFDDKKKDKDESQKRHSLLIRRRFLLEMDAALRDLSQIGIPRIAHHLMETLAYLVDADPLRVFAHVDQIVRAGRKYNYQFEGLAAKLVVEIVERYLAEYRAMLRESAECRQMLREVLDTFVEVGWPDALRLAYRLDEIYR